MQEMSGELASNFESLQQDFCLYRMLNILNLCCQFSYVEVLRSMGVMKNHINLAMRIFRDVY